MMKKILLITALIGAIATTTVVRAESVDFYNQLSNDLNIIQVYETKDLKSDILENRNGNIIIEKIIGEVINSDGDGVILNTDDDNHNYISYQSVEGAEVGDIVLTYCIYNPDTTYTDDIIERFDYIINKK